MGLIMYSRNQVRRIVLTVAVPQIVDYIMALCIKCWNATMHIHCEYSQLHILMWFSRVVLYTCCRDGMARKNEQPRKTDMRHKGGITRNLSTSGYCIARTTATENLQTGLVNVEYLSSHSCHKPSIEECRFLSLSHHSIKGTRKMCSRNNYWENYGEL